ncbi:hypothetical protein GRI40_09725 [Altererythrobacter aerius]|uniref:Uncharacterized protein n=1 Tax=Tsuneonella aeria TaxID=1837929 RepID=A0A6I4TEK5_9SPHN|nr:hypothetical protein [Tsuneonella aeria]MXO75493.1 hypothetical protein [Tsuneonella aeria]
MATDTDTATDGIRPPPQKADPVRSIFIALVGLVLAVVVGAAAFAQAGFALNPMAAAQAFPLDGQALAKEAELQLALARARSRNPILPPDAATIAHARAAYAREPLEPEAVAILANAGAEGDSGQAMRTLEAAHALSRRSIIVNTELISRLSQAGKDEPALRLLDEILRQDTAAQGPLLTQMAAYAGNRSLQPIFLDLLAQDAPWVSPFWRQVAQSPVGLKNAVSLRLGYAGRGGAVDPEVDRLLVAGLAGQARYDDAARLAAGLFPALRSVGTPGSGNLVRDPDFRQKDAVIPFGWEMTSNGDYGAGFQGTGGGIVISALPGSRGTVAQQLVALPSQPLAIGAEVATQSGRRDDLSVELRCAGNAQMLVSVPVSRLPARVPAPSCKWGWLRFVVAIPADGEGADWTVRQVSLTGT